MSEGEPDSDPDRRLRDGFAAAPSIGDHGTPLDPGVIYDAVHGKLNAEQTAAIVDRMAEDADLAEEWRLAKAQAAQEIPTGMDAAPPSNVLEPPAGRWGWALVAVGVAAAAGLALWIAARPRVPQTPVDDPGAVRGDVDPQPSWQLSREETTLRWRAVEGAATYRVQIVDPTFEIVFEARVTQPRVELPPELGGRSDLRWQIDALRRDGTLSSRADGPVPP